MKKEMLSKQSAFLLSNRCCLGSSHGIQEARTKYVRHFLKNCILGQGGPLLHLVFYVEPSFPELRRCDQLCTTSSLLPSLKQNLELPTRRDQAADEEAATAVPARRSVATARSHASDACVPAGNASTPLVAP